MSEFLDLDGLKTFKEKLDIVINTKANSADVTSKLTKKQDSLTEVQINAINSGITSAKVTSYDNHVNNNAIHVTADDKTSWSNKQAALDSTQLAAVNSGITQNKVGTYDGYASTIEKKADSATTANGYGITDVYTKTEIDNKLSGVATAGNIYTKSEIDAMLTSIFKYKGSCSIANLPTSDVSTGDVYNITDGGTIDSANNIVCVAGDNVVWNGSEWDVLSGFATVEAISTSDIEDLFSEDTTE